MVRNYSQRSLQSSAVDITFIAQRCNVASDQIEDVYPATPEQVRMAEESLGHPGSHYFCQGIWAWVTRSQGIDAVRSAVETVTKQFPILRTRLVQGPEGTVWQVVVKDCFDWYGGSAQDFDINNARTFRYGQCLSSWRHSGVDERLPAFEWYWHHSIGDGWSHHLMWEAIDKTLAGEPFRTVPFKRYIAYTMDLPHGQADEFWLKELHHAPSSTLLGKPRADYEAFQKSQHTISIPIKVEASGTITPATIIKAAWALTLAYAEMSNDVVFRTTGTGRNIDMENISIVAGPTLTSFPVRVNIRKEQSIDDFLAGFQKKLNQMARFEYRGLAQIAGLSEDARRACSPDQPYLIVQTTRIPEPKFVHHMPGDWVPSRTPLAVCCIPRPDHVKVVVGYDWNMIDTNRMKMLMLKFEWQLRSLVKLLIIPHEPHAFSTGAVMSEADRWFGQMWEAQTIGR